MVSSVRIKVRIRNIRIVIMMYVCLGKKSIEDWEFLWITKMSLIKKTRNDAIKAAVCSYLERRNYPVSLFGLLHILPPIIKDSVITQNAKFLWNLSGDQHMKNRVQDSGCYCKRNKSPRLVFSFVLKLSCYKPLRWPWFKPKPSGENTNPVEITAPKSI